MYPFKYMLGEMPKKSKTNGNGKKNGTSTKTKEEEFNDSIRDLKISWISKYLLMHLFILYMNDLTPSVAQGS